MSLLWNKILCRAVGTYGRYLNVSTVQLDQSRTESVLWVPRNLGHRIVGKKGETVKYIRLKTSSFINVDLNNIKDGQIPVTLRGTAEACADAREKIEQIRAELTESETTVWIPKAQCGMIIGPGGAVRESLQQDTHTWIYNDKAGVKDGLVPVTINGQVKNCTEAKQRIEQILANDSETTVWIPEAFWGLVLGQRGAMIKTLRQDTDTYIGLDKAGVKDGLVPVTIRGPAENCTEAKQRIEQLLANSLETTVWVPEARCGLVVGKGGATISALWQTTGAFIELDRAGVKDGLVPVTIKGQAEDCAAAKRGIDKILEGLD